MQEGVGEIEFMNEGVISIGSEESILDAALRQAIPLFHVCGGKAKCSTCRVLVLDGDSNLEPMTVDESRLKDKVGFPSQVRLACQARAHGGRVKLRRIIQDETDIKLYIDEKEGNAIQQMGEEQELVLLFLDIRNFTPFVESQLPFDVIHIIRKLFTIFNDVIEKRSGTIVETAGDGIYAVFGCGEDRAISAASAVEAAFTIFSELEELNSSYFTQHFATTLKIGIGVHIGQVVRGQIRIAGSDYTIVMGHPVNVAARLQNATKELNNSFVVSEDLYKLLPSSDQRWPSTILHAKGVSSDMTVYLLGSAYH